MNTLVYTLADCEACNKVKALLRVNGEDYYEIPIDNPLLELGVKTLFNDEQIHAPIVLRPNQGVFMLMGNELVKIVYPTN